MKLGEQSRDQFFHEIDVETGNTVAELSVDSRLRTILLGRQENEWNAARRSQKIIDEMF